GYGLGRRVCNPLAIHAGLLGQDALLFLDEAHLSHPFEETLAALARYRTWAEVPILTPWHVVRLSATPPASEARGCREGARDRAHPVLGPRLRARKAAHVVEVRVEPSRGNDPPARRRTLETANQATFIERTCQEALALLAQDPAVRVLGLVVNRVGTARAVFE